jgi:hypothetical protein
VTKTSETPNEDERLPVNLSAAEQSSESLPKTIEEEVEPTLSAFFGNKKVRVAAFLNSVKKAKIGRFTQSDESNASELMKTNDVNGERLWMLLSQPNLPECLERWMWQVAQNRLTAVVGTKFDPLNQTTAESLSAIRAYHAKRPCSPRANCSRRFCRSLPTKGILPSIRRPVAADLFVPRRGPSLRPS